MAKRVGDEMKNEVLQVVERPGRNQDCENQSVETVLETETQHPYAFHVSGPRNVPSINWRDLINSTWKDGNYKRTVIACFIQAVYLLELDRQENRTSENALAPKWWIPFKYKLVETLIDERDGSVFGAILEWDRAAALADFVLMRPSGAPRAVLALRGTLLKSPTIRRDIEDDLRFLAWESLKGSVRFILRSRR
ncbi:UNVERIFIED_CONTAM: hypothetical protein Sradi_6087600 [Sesamum radiatum]|uniref:Uncharacterized protein n=1 Tax=Sesamum radiatum TaxID=300843 RepID=A0AAW2KJQ8_SESRA